VGALFPLCVKSTDGHRNWCLRQLATAIKSLARSLNVFIRPRLLPNKQMHLEFDVPAHYSRNGNGLSDDPNDPSPLFYLLLWGADSRLPFSIAATPGSCSRSARERSSFSSGVRL